MLLLLLLPAALLLTANLQLVGGGPPAAVSVGSLVRALDYMKENPETLEEMMSEDHAVLEGDMLMDMDRNAVERAWPTRRLPYVISPELAERTDDIQSAMAMVSEQTCVSFHRRRGEDDFLRFQSGHGCASYVGCIGGEQPVFIGPPCSVGNIAHELLHALGFHHEHTRTDREQHVTILAQNILHGKERNFRKVTGKTFGLTYDLTSIMHYGGWFFSSNGLPTIVAAASGVMGQRDHLTAGDVQRVRLLYACDAAEKKPHNQSDDGDSQLQDSRYGGYGYHGYPYANYGGYLEDDGQNSSRGNQSHVSISNGSGVQMCLRMMFLLSDASQNPHQNRSSGAREQADRLQQDQNFYGFFEKLRRLIAGLQRRPAATRGSRDNS